MTHRSAARALTGLSAVLAVPGTVVHGFLGHIDWAVAATLSVTSVPASRLGATVAIRTASDRLERLYGAALVVLGAGLLLVS
ncbi:MAG TPA: hypothetical protein PKX25_17120, partial [Microthrixaceae bacterium]|nr:hypothetical protein [Microthrixaceae bacterium]